MKEAFLNYIANDIDKILYRKREGETLKNHLTNYLNSYFFSLLSYDEALLLQTRIDTILQLLDRVMKAGDLEKIERSLRRLTFLLEQELQDELVYKYLKISSRLG